MVIDSKIVNRSIKNSKITKNNKKVQTTKKLLYVQYFNMDTNMAAKSI